MASAIATAWTRVQYHRAFMLTQEKLGVERRIYKIINLNMVNKSIQACYSVHEKIMRKRARHDQMLKCNTNLCCLRKSNPDRDDARVTAAIEWLIRAA